MRSRGCRRRWSGPVQVPPVRTRCAGADCPWLQARGSPGVGSSSVQWLGAQVPGLAVEEALLLALGCLPDLPAPSLILGFQNKNRVAILAELDKEKRKLLKQNQSSTNHPGARYRRIIWFLYLVIQKASWTELKLVGSDLFL